MTIEEIIVKRQELEKTIRYGLTIHTKSDIIKEARTEMLALREKCPHDGNSTKCSYCGKAM